MLRNQDCLPAYVIYFGAVPWQLFCTFTFAWPVSDARAAQVFTAFIGSLEKAYGCPIGWIRGDEKRFSGCGKPGAPRHYHVLMAASRKLDRHRVGDTWMSMAGYRRDGAGADARVYDPSLEGIAYVLKFIFMPEGEWDFQNLDLFLGETDSKKMNHRKRRRLSRQNQRLEVVNGADLRKRRNTKMSPKRELSNE